MSEEKKEQFIGFGYDLPGNPTRINIPLEKLKKMVVDLEHSRDELKGYERIDVSEIGLSVRLDSFTDIITAQYYYKKYEK